MVAFRNRLSYRFFRQACHWLAQHEGQLKERMFRGGIWLTVGNGFSRVASLVRLAVLARLLSPDDFGLIGIGMLMVGWFEQFSQTGFRQALLRTPGDIQPYLNTLWSVQVVRGIFLCLGLWMAAPLAGWFFDNAGAVPVVQTLSLLGLLRALTSPAVVYLSRELDFRRVVWWNMSQVISGLIVAIICGVIYRNVWALVYSLLVGQAVHSFVSYTLHPYRPRFGFNASYARDMADFGKWFFCKQLFDAVITQLDSLYVGRLLGTTTLGLYQIGFRLAMLPSQLTYQVLPRVSFPAFAKLKGAERRRDAYLQVLECTALFGLPMLAVLVVFPDVIVHWFLGENWRSIVPLIPLLAICGGLRTILDVARPMFDAIGRPDIRVKTQCVEILGAIVLLALFVPRGGLPGVAWALIAINLLLVGIQGVILSRVIDLPWRQALSALQYGGVAALPIGGMGLVRILSTPAVGVLIACGSVSIFVSLWFLWCFGRRYLPRFTAVGASG